MEAERKDTVFIISGTIISDCSFSVISITSYSLIYSGSRTTTRRCEFHFLSKRRVQKTHKRGKVEEIKAETDGARAACWEQNVSVGMLVTIPDIKG